MLINQSGIMHKLNYISLGVLIFCLSCSKEAVDPAEYYVPGPDEDLIVLQDHAVVLTDEEEDLYWIEDNGLMFDAKLIEDEDIKVDDIILISFDSSEYVIKVTEVLPGSESSKIEFEDTGIMELFDQIDLGLSFDLFDAVQPRNMCTIEETETFLDNCELKVCANIITPELTDLRIHGSLEDGFVLELDMPIGIEGFLSFDCTDFDNTGREEIVVWSKKKFSCLLYTSPSPRD